MVNFFEASHCDDSGNQSAEEVPQTKIAQVVSDRPSGEKSWKLLLSGFAKLNVGSISTFRFISYQMKAHKWTIMFSIPSHRCHASMFLRRYFSGKAFPRFCWIAAASVGIGAIIARDRSSIVGALLADSWLYFYTVQYNSIISITAVILIILLYWYTDYAGSVQLTLTHISQLDPWRHLSMR